MIIAVFILDFLYRQNSVFDGDPAIKQQQVTEPKTVKGGSQKQSSIKPQPQIKLINIKTTLKAEGSKLKAILR
jgi:hypothetical protein